MHSTASTMVRWISTRSGNGAKGTRSHTADTKQLLEAKLVSAHLQMSTLLSLRTLGLAEATEALLVAVGQIRGEPGRTWAFQLQPFRCKVAPRW